MASELIDLLRYSFSKMSHLLLKQQILVNLLQLSFFYDYMNCKMKLKENIGKWKILQN